MNKQAQIEFSNIELIKGWVRKILPNAQAVGLALILFIGSMLIFLLSDLLMPVFVAIVLAYLLEGIVVMAEERNVPRFPAVLVVYTVFLLGFGYLLFVLMPLLFEQTKQLVQHVPEIVKSLQKEILLLPEAYPQFISEKKLKGIIFSAQEGMLKYSQDVVTVSAASLFTLITIMVYLILVPVLIFFLLKDKVNLVCWFSQFLPRDRNLSVSVWKEVDMQIGNYVRGKFVEILLMWLVSYITFSAMGLRYAMLLAVFMGLQVIIPYVGATLVTFPVLAVAYFQWGVGDDFLYILIAYSVIQTLDGVVLVPLLFSEAVNLHPIAIIVAILFFGGLWGFWGVFFAIPLATLVKAVLTAWPRIGETHSEQFF